MVFHLVGLGEGAPEAEYARPGDPDEAAVYAALACPWWRNTEPALLWLLARLKAIKEEAEPAPRA